MASKNIGIGTCACGKLNLQEHEAARIVRDPNMGSKRYYQCNLSGHYHTTKQKPSRYNRIAYTVKPAGFNIKRLQKELKEDMTGMSDKVIRYMEGEYKRSGKYKFSNNDLVEHFKGYNPGSISTLITTLKARRVITDIETVPYGKTRIKYYGLTKVLNEVTNPKSEPKSEPKETSVTKPPTPPTPTTVATNPFDKVNSQLGELLAKINGLVNGYTEIARAVEQRNIEEPLNRVQRSILAKLNELSAINELKPPAAMTTADTLMIANAVNNKLGDATKEDAFIYRVRDEVLDGVEEVIKRINVPESVSDSDDYKRGLKDGIRLCAEMKLTVPNE